MSKKLLNGHVTLLQLHDNSVNNYIIVTMCLVIKYSIAFIPMCLVVF